MQRHRQVKTPKQQPKRRRVPMKAVVGKVVDKWSTSFLDNALKGHVPSMLKVAELQHTGAGFGKIKYNPVQGRRWVEYAATHSQSIKAKEALRRLVVREERTKDQIQQLTRYALHKGESLAYDYDPYNNFALFDSKGASIRHQLAWSPHSPKGRQEAMGGVRDYNNQDTNRMKISPSVRLLGGDPAVPKRFPQIASRFELNYAVKAVLDEKMQRKITDPIPRPIHEYTMVSKTPVPEYVNGAAQSIHLAEVLKDQHRVSLDVHITGKTYLKEGATLADLPKIPTPVGTIAQYKDLVDDEHDMVEDITKGAKVGIFDVYHTLYEQKEQSFWPNDNPSIMSHIKNYRAAYSKTLGEQQHKGRKFLATQHDHEHHGQYESRHENAHLEELNERSDHDFNMIAPHQLYVGPQEDLTDDPDMQLDNVRRFNIGFTMAREHGTPVDEGGRFPYNGLPRRNFFLSDPFNLMKPWLTLNAEGTDMGEEQLPESPYTMMLQEGASRDFYSSLPFDAHQDFVADHMFAPQNDLHPDYDGAQYLDDNPFSPDFIPKHAVIDTFEQDSKMLAKIYNPNNYLQLNDFKATYKLLKIEDPLDKSTFFNNDVIDITKLSNIDINDTQKMAQQTEDMAKKFFLIFKSKMYQEVTSPFALETQPEYHLSPKAKARHGHPDFYGADTVVFPKNMTRIADRIKYLRNQQALDINGVLPAEFVTASDAERELGADEHGALESHLVNIDNRPNFNHKSHPADGSPIPLTPETAVTQNRMKFLQLCLPVFEDVDALDTDEEAYNKIVKRTHAMLIKHSKGELNPDAEEFEASSGDEEKYFQITPFIRPYIQYAGAHHPFWNRIVPNPAVWNCNENNDRYYNRRQMSYEASMWNDFANGKMSRDEVLSATTHANDQLFDINRAREYADGDSSDIDYSRVYTRAEVHDKLQSGRFTVVRRDEVVTEKPQAVSPKF